jgi:hypothetical protein
MAHVVAAARGEFAKLERPAPSELTGLARYRAGVA